MNPIRSLLLIPGRKSIATLSAVPDRESCARVAQHAWKIAIVVGLLLAAALIVIPRATAFEGSAEDACTGARRRYVGLYGDSGRYADPVPEGARCLPAGEVLPVEVPVRFFADDGTLDAALGWAYRLACIVLPLGCALLIGTRLSRPPQTLR